MSSERDRGAQADKRERQTTKKKRIEKGSARSDLNTRKTDLNTTTETATQERDRDGERELMTTVSEGRSAYTCVTMRYRVY